MSLPTTLTLQELKTALHTALHARRTVGGTAESLLAFLLLVQEQRACVARDGSPATLRLATNQVLETGLQILAKQNAQQAAVLRARFPEDNTLRATGNRLNLSSEQVSRIQKKALNSLAAILLDQEQTVREARVQTIEANLPPPAYLHLFGLDAVQNLLVEKLLSPKAPWVVAIQGIGGIGKTALADAVIRRVIRHFHYEDVIYLRLKHQQRATHPPSSLLSFEILMADLALRLCPDMPDGVPVKQQEIEVRQALKSRPYLVVIDNLETQADMAYLLTRLSDLARPGKFLLTSRTRPFGQTPVFAHSLDELSFKDTAALVRHRAEVTGTAAKVDTSQEALQTLYEVVGGNPLALIIIVGLARVLPMQKILAELSQSRVGPAAPIEKMYLRIYWQAWQTLSAEARALLQAMPLIAASGALPDQLQAICDLSEAQFWPAVTELFGRSLLEVRGTPQQKRYAIHRLTETFLRTEIIHWPEETL
ncbi:MAG: NB-ARC domain-containing protein [Anaerolineales bacterium]